MLNPNIMRAAAKDFESSVSGVTMVNNSIKLPPGFKEELDVIAADYGMNWAQLLRTLGHLLRAPKSQ